MKYWEFFKKNYLVSSSALTLVSILAMFWVEPVAIFVPISTLIIGLVFIPVWGYLKFKKYV